MYLGQDGLQSNLKVYVQYSLLHYQWFSFFSPSAPVTVEENIYLKPDEQMCACRPSVFDHRVSGAPY